MKNQVQDLDRLPPSNPDAEMCVLGSLMLDPLMHRQIRRILRAEHFYSADNAIIYRIANEIAESGRALDGVILREALAKRKLLEEVGGLPYLAQILNTMPSAAHGLHYAGIVIECWKLREAVRIGNQLLQAAYDPQRDGDAQKILSNAAMAMMKAGHYGLSIKITPLGEAVHNFVERRESEQTPAILTGFKQIDAQFPGVIAESSFTIIGAMPSVGKSLIEKNLADRQGAMGINVGICSLEESEEKIAGNFISAHSGVQNKRLAYGNLDAQDWLAITGCLEDLSKRPILIADQIESMNELMLTIEIMAEEHKRRVIYVDHLHLIGGLPGDNQEQRIARASKALKDAAKRHKIGIVALAQLSRPAEKRGDPGPPTMRDLRDSGMIEANADGIILLHRADYFHRFDNNYQPTDICQVIIAKARNGEVGDVLLKTDLDTQRLLEIEDYSPDGFTQEQMFR